MNAYYRYKGRSLLQNNIFLYILGKTCGDTFSRLQILKVHETKHTNERPFLCETCGWSGKTKNALIVHTKIHTGMALYYFDLLSLFVCMCIGYLLCFYIEDRYVQLEFRY